MEKELIDTDESFFEGDEEAKKKSKKRKTVSFQTKGDLDNSSSLKIKGSNGKKRAITLTP